MESQTLADRREAGEARVASRVASVSEPHASPWRDVAGALRVSTSEGLGDAEARRKLEWFGPNALREHARKSAWAILADQFKSLVVLLLAAAAVVSFALGEAVEEAAITASVLVALALALSWLNLSEAGAVTISFLTPAFAQLFHVFNMRDASAGFLDNDVTRNPYVWLALLLCAALLVGSAYLPVPSTVLELEPPDVAGWVLILALGIVPLLVGEAARRRGKN